MDTPFISEKLKSIAQYEIKRLLGEGGMSVVYLAYDRFRDMEVAVKVSKPVNIENKAKYQKMFFNEARIAGMLIHQNILKVYDAGVENGMYYMVIEHVKDGHTLKEFCTFSNLLPIEKIIHIIFKCCKALDYAHRMSVIHKDIKPSNILLTSDFDVKIADFGIAQIIRTETTQPAELIGSPAYMSPEQIKEENLDNQTDIFSLGVVLYELVTGRSPFFADKFAGVVRKVLYFDPPPITVYRSDAPIEIDTIIRKAINKKKSNRFLTAGEFAKSLNIVFGNLKSDDEDIDRSEKFMLIRNMSFFKSFTDSELWEIVGAVSVREFISGADIITEGALEETFYIIIEGQAVMLKGDNQIGTLQKGDCFGEMGYLAKSKNSATIKAVSNLKLLEVNNYAIEESSTGCQLRFNKIFLKRIIERLSKVNVEL